jgi:hypothetical protein
MGGYVTRVGTGGTTIGFGGKVRGKDVIRKPRRSCMNNTKMDLGKKGWGLTDCTGLDQDEDNWTAKDKEHSGSTKC